MLVGKKIFLFLFTYIVTIATAYTQDNIMDPETHALLDSLDQRVKTIQNELPRISNSRNANYFYKKHELDMTIFLSCYHRYVFDEDLEMAKTLIDSRLGAAEKRGDQSAVEFYKKYSSMLTYERIHQKERYQFLFKKEKNFRKEFYRFINEGDEYSLQRAKRLTELALKYAKEQNLENAGKYLINYEQLANAFQFDYFSEYDLVKLTSSESGFQKVFKPLIESDSLELLKNAGELVEHCFSYSKNTLSVLDTSYFSLQKKVVKTSISDYYERKGNNLNMANMLGQAIIARLDTLNLEGIYKWHDRIVVVSTINLIAKFENVRKGEAIIDADRKLTEYIRVNRLAKIGNEVKMGTTYLIPYLIDNHKNDFHFNEQKKAYQYMVCYTQIESKYFTQGISKFLPPLQFIEETLQVR
jgi:hypothetical protein